MTQTQNQPTDTRQTPTPLLHVVCDDCLMDAPIFGMVALCGARPSGPRSPLSDAECVVCVDLLNQDAPCPRCGR